MTLHVLGIDGGGTRTRCAIVDGAGRLRGVGLGGGSNYDDVGVDAARAAISAAVDAARRAAGLGDAPFDAAFLGVAGVVSEHDRAAIRGIARDLRLAPPERVAVDHDCRVALAGGLSGRPGIVLIAGTGSSCYGRDAEGNSWRAGGWGALIADEGSGYWLGVQALRAAVCAYDGRIGPTLLLDIVRKRLALTDMDEIMHRLYIAGMARAEIATLATDVLSAAEQGDVAARALVVRAAEDLADCVRAVALRLHMEAGRCELALVGGLLHDGSALQAPLRAALAERLPNCRVSAPELAPVLGACVLALLMAGGEADGQVIETLRHTAQLREGTDAAYNLA